jgi:hypothetical protein
MFCGHTTVFLGQMLGSLGEADLLGQKQGGSKGDGWIWTAHIRSRGFVHSESHRSFSSHEKNSITLLVMAVASTLQQPAWLWGKYQVNGQLKTVVECICSLTHDITSTRVLVDLLFTFLLRTSVVNFFLWGPYYYRIEELTKMIPMYIKLLTLDTVVHNKLYVLNGFDCALLIRVMAYYAFTNGDITQLHSLK